ncbi:TetR/AcrR family transcriptional regulator [Microbacterium gorillae]|uniref:TetR/AcrR family transcriptional regulator n=1 Tax=Microbacterium gorillae TaxID=1231063 RepID=UPI000693409A|nr:TetR family transcriptional regulator C-terminal domain-containing protein [Microbacterium gorillae]
MTYSARQLELADAGLALTARSGLAAVTFRTVAAESGWSVGAVQKAFATKDALLSAMFARLRERDQPLPEAPPGQPTVTEWLTELFVLMMPLDPERRTAYVLGAAFGERVPFDDAIAAAVRASDAEIEARIAALIGLAKSTGEAGSGVDPVSIAAAYLALATGCATRLLATHEPEDVVRERATAWISALLR